MESKMVENFNQWGTAGLWTRQTASFLISSTPTYADQLLEELKTNWGWGDEMRASIISPLALRPRTRGSPENSLSEKITREVSGSSASGGLFLLHCLHGRIWSRCLHAVFMWQLAHIIWFWRKCGLQLQKHPSLCSVHAIHWCPEISNLPRWVNSPLKRNSTFMSMKTCRAHILSSKEKQVGILCFVTALFSEASFMEQRIDKSGTPPCCSKIVDVVQTPAACTRVFTAVTAIIQDVLLETNVWITNPRERLFAG